MKDFIRAMKGMADTETVLGWAFIAGCIAFIWILAYAVC